MAEALRWVRARRIPIPIRSSRKGWWRFKLRHQRRSASMDQTDSARPIPTALLKSVEHQHCREREQSNAMRRIHASNMAKEDLPVLPKDSIHIPYVCSGGNPLDSKRTTGSTFTKSVMNRVPPLVVFLTKSALLCSTLLLLSNLQVTSTKAHAWLSSLPLALAGVAYAVLQIRLSPDRWTLAKRLFLAASFVLWAIDQFLQSGRLAMFVGDAVVSAYVLDLFWIIQEQRESHNGESKPSADIEFEERGTR